jgi:hypothetical protein
MHERLLVIKTVPRPNVWRHNVRRDKTSGDITSGDITDGDITSVGHDVRRDKTSVRTKRPDNQMSVETKRPKGQNFRRQTHKKVRREHPFSLFSKNSAYIFFLTQDIIYSLITVHLYNVIVRMLTVLINIKELY